MRLSRIFVYPIKSLDAVAVERAEVLAGGALRHDRRYALLDADGNLVNGKRTPLMNRVRARFDLDGWHVELGEVGQGAVFHLDRDRQSLAAALSRSLEHDVHLVENADTGFPDDLESPGPTLVSAGTLRAVAAWFPGLDASEVRRRFRANLEIEGTEGLATPPFWEDRLCGPAGQPIRFRIGDVVLEGTNPCPRCIVPTRDSTTGDAWPRFAKAFAEQREAALPPWAERSRFDHFYRLAVNTRLAGAGGTIRVGDAVEVLT